MKISAVIFDVDGTLLNTEPVYMEAWRQAAKKLGFQMSEEYLQKTRGVNINDSIRLFGEYFGAEHSYAEVRAIRVSVAEEILSKSDPKLLLKPYAAEALDALDKKGLPKAVATSTDREKNEAHLRHVGLWGRFSTVISGDMIEKGKPNPDIFLAAAKGLGLPPEECLVVEDSPAGVEAAFRAGMHPVLVPDCVKPDEITLRRAIAVLRSLIEFPDLIQKLTEE